MGTFDTQHQITVEDDRTMELDLEDTIDGDGALQSSRQSLSKTVYVEASDPEKGSTSPDKKQRGSKHREPDVVEKSAKAYQENPRPYRLGKMYTCWYNRKGQPRIVIGPDFGFSLIELGMTNGICGAVVNGARNAEYWTLFTVGLLFLLLHDLFFILTVVKNPGLPPRNPNEHSKGYLNKVKTIE